MIQAIHYDSLMSQMNPVWLLVRQTQFWITSEESTMTGMIIPNWPVAMKVLLMLSWRVRLVANRGGYPKRPTQEPVGAEVPDNEHTNDEEKIDKPPDTDNNTISDWFDKHEGSR